MKKVILIFVTRRPLLLKTTVPSRKWFFRKHCVFRAGPQHALALRLVMPHLVSHLTSPHQAAFQCLPGLILMLHVHLRKCSENLFFHELPPNQGKVANQLRQQLHENCRRDRKIFPQTWKKTKIQTNMVTNTTNILCVRRKNRLKMVCYKLFANILRTLY